MKSIQKNKTKTKTNVLFSIDKNLMKTFRPVAKKYGNKLSYVVETGIKKYFESRI